MYTFKVVENKTNSTSDIISNASSSSMASLLQQQRVISETAESLWLRKHLSYRSSSHHHHHHHHHRQYTSFQL